MPMTRTTTVCLAIVLAACSGESDPADAGVDSSVSVSDSGGDADALGDDAGPTGVDMDGDGLSADRDCDDMNAALGDSAERTCSGACGDGLERCSAGVWGMCDAPADCVCSTPGMMRLVGCERCGTQSQRCSDAGVWEAASVCTDQQECEVADVEERRSSRCGTEQRVCGAMCAWGEWTLITAEGECAPGEAGLCPGSTSRLRVCDEMCRWGDCL